MQLIASNLWLQNRAVVNLFRGPNLIDDVAITMKQLERGDLKLRVRSLEAERALTRVEVSHPNPSASCFVRVVRPFGRRRGLREPHTPHQCC